MKTGIVIVGHGSRTKESRGIYEEIARLAEEKSEYKVHVGYMKHGRPTLIEAVNGCVEEGVKRIIIVPLFLLPGLHVMEDIPILLGMKEGETPEFGYDRVKVPEDVEILYANHIGADERLADVVMDRVEDVLK